MHIEIQMLQLKYTFSVRIHYHDPSLLEIPFKDN